MRRHTEQLWMSLLRAGVVQGAAPQAGKPESPWYVKILLAVSAWVASLFLLGFLAMACMAIIDDDTVAFFTGAIMILIAFAILRSSRNEFVEHLALAASLAGQALIIYSIFDDFEGRHWHWVVLLQAVLIVIMPNFIHRVFSACVAGLAFFMALLFSGWSFAADGALMCGAAWCWLNEFCYPKQIRQIQAVGYGLVLALILLKSVELSGYKVLGWIGYYRPETWGQPWMGELLTGAAVLYVVWDILQRYRQPILKPLALMALLATAVVCGLSLEVHGLTVGMMLIVLGFAGTNRLLLGLGIVSLLLCISSYYYLLDLTLLVKSSSLCVTGLSLLVLRWFMLRVLPAKKEEQHV